MGAQFVLLRPLIAMALPKAMKAKAMKSKRVSKIARGRMARSQVLTGRKEKTTSGLTAKDFMKNKYGKIVSRKRSAFSARRAWPKAVQQARKALSVKGFIAINGKSAEGKALYAKAKSIISGQ